MYGPAYFTPLPPRLNAADLTLLDTLGRSFARGTSVSVAPVATDRIRCAYTQPMVLEKLIGDRMTRLRSLCLMYDRTSVYVGDDSWPPIPNPEQIAATGSVPGGGASGGSTKKKTRPKTANKPSPCETRLFKRSLAPVLLNPMLLQFPLQIPLRKKTYPVWVRTGNR